MTRTIAEMGKLIGASLGPGDAGLITRRAWNALHSSARWAYPVRRRSSNSYALDIARRAGLTPPDDAVPLVFPMTHDTDILARHWLKAAVTVLDILREGKDVVFLVEGDASTYSTYNHLLRTVRALEPSVPVETIAGVASYQAVAAQVQTSLTDADDTMAIIPAAYGIDTVERLLQDFDTLVLLKVKPLLDDLIVLLTRRGLLEHASFVEKVGTPEERVISDITCLHGQPVSYLSLLLVKNPDRIKGERQRGCRKQEHLSQSEETP